EWTGGEWVGDCYQEAVPQWTHTAGEDVIDRSGNKRSFFRHSGSTWVGTYFGPYFGIGSRGTSSKVYFSHDAQGAANGDSECASFQYAGNGDAGGLSTRVSFLDHGTIYDYYYDEFLDIYRPQVHPLANNYHRLPFMNIFDFRNHSYSDLDFEEAVYAKSRKNIVDLNTIIAEGNLKSNYRLLLDLNDLIFEVISTKWEEIQTGAALSETLFESDMDSTRATIASIFSQYQDSGAEIEDAFDIAKANTASAVAVGQFRSSNETAGEEVSLTIGVAKVALDSLLSTEETEMGNLITGTSTDVVSLTNTAQTDIANELNTAAMVAEITARETAITNSINDEKSKVSTAVTAAEGIVTSYFVGKLYGSTGCFLIGDSVGYRGARFVYGFNRFAKCNGG
ncbi:hypothetical protein HC823_00935, partial [Candidatus Gracilibacteria bacterium]|nr:hypothetical protein [Candidatus Gracilibacteria bacterium]